VHDGGWRIPGLTRVDHDDRAALAAQLQGPGEAG
jgi:hypothetical protein